MTINKVINQNKYLHITHIKGRFTIHKWKYTNSVTFRNPVKQWMLGSSISNQNNLFANVNSKSKLFHIKNSQK